MKPYSLSHFVIPDGWEHEGCIYVEPLDWWKNCYKIEFLHHIFLANADNESEAMDSLIDWFVDNMPHYLWNEDDVTLMSQEELDDFHCGGNDGRYLNEISYRVTVVNFPYVLIDLIKVETYDDATMFEEKHAAKQKVELQNLQDFHEFELTFYDAKMGYVASMAWMPTGDVPYVQYQAKFFLPDGKLIEDKSFYDWLLEVVY